MTWLILSCSYRSLQSTCKRYIMNHCDIVCKLLVALLFAHFVILWWKIQGSKWFRLWQERTWDGGVAGLDRGGPSLEASICYYWESYCCCNASSFHPWRQEAAISLLDVDGDGTITIEDGKACRLVKKMHISRSCGACVKDFCTLGTELKGQAMDLAAVSECKHLVIGS